MAEIKKINTELQPLGKLLDTSGDEGVSGQILSSTGSGTNWIDNVGGSGIFLPLAGGTMTGNINMNANKVEWDESGVRSWDMYPTAGSLYIAAGDGSGTLNLQTGLFVNKEATFAGDVTVTGGTISSTSGGDAFVISKSTSTTGRGFLKSVGDTGSVLFSAVYGSASTGTIFGTSLTRAAVLITTSDASVHPTSLLVGTFTGIPLIFGTNNTEALKLDTSQNATFAGTIDSGTITSTGIVKTSTTFQSTGGSMLFFVPNVGQALEIAQNTGNATFTGNVTIDHSTNVDSTLKLHAYSSGIGDAYAWNLTAENSANSYAFRILQGTSPVFTIANTASGATLGNATFAGAITSTANISGVNLIASTAVYSGGIVYGSSTLSLKKSNGNSYIDFDTNLNATFAGQVTIPATPTANTHAASKQYVDNSIASGLTYMGTWDARNNSERGSGTDGGIPDLRLTANKIEGDYYIVNVAGSATPNGDSTTPNEFAVGDWCIYTDAGSLGDQWQKIDNTSALTGTGTGDILAMWTGSGTSVTLGNAPITVSSGNTTVTGKLGIGALNASFNLYNNGTTYLNGVTTVDAAFTQSGGDASTFSGNVTSAGTIFASNNSPAYSFSSDTNTGIARTGTHQMGFLNNNSTSLTLAADLSATFAGDVLLSSTKGLYTNTVQAVSSAGLKLGNDDNSQYIFVKDDTGVGIGTTNPDSKLHIHQTGSGTLTTIITEDDARKIFIGRDAINCKDLSNNAALLYLNQAGGNVTISNNLGIGTSSPEAKLHVYSGNASIVPNGDGDEFVIENSGNAGMSILTGNTSNGAIFFGDTQDNNVGIIDYDHNTNSMSFTTGASTGLTIDSSQRVGIGTTSPTGYKLVVENTSEDLLKLYNSTDGLDALISFQNPGGTLGRIQGIDNGGLGFDVGNNAGGINSNVMFINNTGNVGIGTVSPSTKLQVAGIIQINESGETAFYEGHGVRVFGTQNYRFRNTGGGVRAVIDVNSTGVTAGNLSLYNASNVVTSYINNAGNSYLNGGNVGIGTTNPSFQLSIENHATTSSIATFEIDGKRTNGTDGAVGEMIFSNNGDTFATVAGFRDGADNKGSLQFQTQDSTFATRMTISSEGNVGIGTTSPSFKLHVNSAENGATAIGVGNTGSGASRVYLDASNGDFSGSDYMWLGQNNDLSGEIFMPQSAGSFNIKTQPGGTSTTRFTVTQAGNIGIGTTSPVAKLEVAGEIRVADGTKGTPSYSFTSDTNTGMFSDTADVLEFAVGGDTNLQMRSGYLDITQYIRHIGDADTYFGFTAANQFQVIAGGNTNLNVQGNGVDLSYAGSTKLNTQTGGVKVTGDLIVTENVGIGVTNPDVPLSVSINEDGSGISKGAAKFINTNTGQGATTMHMVQTSSGSFANAVKFWQGGTPTAVGFIRLTTSATQFITSASDLNLKKNITNWSDDTLSKFKALEPKKFRFKTQDVSEDKTLGFIAQNEVSNFPEAYPQFLGEDEKPYYGFNPSGMVPYLMKAIKDLVEKVETLENKITQLENNI